MLAAFQEFVKACQNSAQAAFLRRASAPSADQGAFLPPRYLPIPPPYLPISPPYLLHISFLPPPCLPRRRSLPHISPYLPISPPYLLHNSPMPLTQALASRPPAARCSRLARWPAKLLLRFRDTFRDTSETLPRPAVPRAPPALPCRSLVGPPLGRRRRRPRLAAARGGNSNNSNDSENRETCND